ncbi:hypothetical protein OF83DRAFT_1179015 [Amylostereum chailletii]|nr:hypothetical protein OF83DRAFT_1179015 [Amylostereum chailletii]
MNFNLFRSRSPDLAIANEARMQINKYRRRCAEYQAELEASDKFEEWCTQRKKKEKQRGDAYLAKLQEVEGRNLDLEHEKAELASQLEATELEVTELRRNVRHGSPEWPDGPHTFDTGGDSSTPRPPSSTPNELPPGPSHLPYSPSNPEPPVQDRGTPVRTLNNRGTMQSIRDATVQLHQAILLLNEGEQQTTSEGLQTRLAGKPTDPGEESNPERSVEGDILHATNKLEWAAFSPEDFDGGQPHKLEQMEELNEAEVDDDVRGPPSLEESGGARDLHGAKPVEEVRRSEHGGTSDEEQQVDGVKPEGEEAMDRLVNQLRDGRRARDGLTDVHESGSEAAPQLKVEPEETALAHAEQEIRSLKAKHEEELCEALLAKDAHQRAEKRAERAEDNLRALGQRHKILNNSYEELKETVQRLQQNLLDRDAELSLLEQKHRDSTTITAPTQEMVDLQASLRSANARASQLQSELEERDKSLEDVAHKVVRAEDDLREQKERYTDLDDAYNKAIQQKGKAEADVSQLQKNEARHRELKEAVDATSRKAEELLGARDADIEQLKLQLQLLRKEAQQKKPPRVERGSQAPSTGTQESNHSSPASLITSSAGPRAVSDGPGAPAVKKRNKMTVGPSSRTTRSGAAATSTDGSVGQSQAQDSRQSRARQTGDTPASAHSPPSKASGSASHRPAFHT